MREYDPVIGRWTAVDPKRQYHSPYLSMGNNPVSSLDSDGGDDVYFNKDGSYARTVDRNWFIDTFIGHRGYLEGTMEVLAGFTSMIRVMHYFLARMDNMMV